MAHWDGNRLVSSWQPEFVYVNDPDDPTWIVFDCGCCNGLKWSNGTEPIECECGDGSLFVHIATGTVAAWPGGPLVGAHLTMNEADKLYRRARNEEYRKAVRGLTAAV